MKEEFNYVVAQMYDGQHQGRLDCYGIHSSEVFYGNQEDAEDTLKYVQRQSPDKTWNIYNIDTNGK